MKNLLYISGSILPSKYANSVHVTKMCQALSDWGLNITLLGMGGESKVNVHNFYNVKKTFSIKTSKSYKNRFIRFVNYNLFCLKHVAKSDTVYLRYLYSLIWCMLLNKPFIVEFHSLPENKHLVRLLNKAFKSKSFISAIFITKSLKDAFLEMFIIKESKCKVLPDCADKPQTIKENTDANEIGYVGHLYEGRGIELIIKIAESLPESNFHIIGGHDEDVEKFKNISPINIRYYGFVTQNQLQDIYNKFSIAIAPYQQEVGVGKAGMDTAKWMSPMKIFEYMSFKKAIVLSDLPVLHEIGKHDKHLMFCRPDDYKEWVNTIVNIQQNINLFNSLKNNAYNLFVNQYTWNGRAKNISNILNLNEK